MSSKQVHFPSPRQRRRGVRTVDPAGPRTFVMTMLKSGLPFECYSGLDSRRAVLSSSRSNSSMSWVGRHSSLNGDIAELIRTGNGNYTAAYRERDAIRYLGGRICLKRTPQMTTILIMFEGTSLHSSSELVNVKIPSTMSNAVAYMVSVAELTSLVFTLLP